MSRLINIARASALAGLVAAGVALPAFTSAPAFAADGDPLPQGVLDVRGADFTSPPAVAHLKRQLRHVATDICMAHTGGRIFMNRSEQACYDTAVKDGLAQIESRQQQAMRAGTSRFADIKAGDNSAE